MKKKLIITEAQYKKLKSNLTESSDPNSFYIFQGEQTFESWVEEGMSLGQMKTLSRLLQEGIQSGFEKALRSG
jgi:hypothetical protein